MIDFIHVISITSHLEIVAHTTISLMLHTPSRYNDARP